MMHKVKEWFKFFGFRQNDIFLPCFFTEITFGKITSHVHPDLNQ